MIHIPKHPNIKDIPTAINQLIDIDFDFSTLINNNLLEKINHKQFLFLIGIAAFEGIYFSKNMEFIKKYINKIDKKNLNLLLELELNLHNIFLKKYETEETYNKFYLFFSGLYPINNLNIDNKPITRILFYVPNPVFLAHTNPLFYMLKQRKDKNVEVSIASRGYNEEFKKKCNKLGVKFYDIAESELSLSFKKLKEISEKYDRIIWQSVPVHLAYFRSISNKVCYWSFKFHPDITNIRCYIGIFKNNNKSILYNNNVWKNIDVGFELENFLKDKLDWKKRKLKFGAFCREELIDEEKYWQTVKLILQKNKDSTFYYCGRNSIHSKWMKKLNIETSKVIFLGWLANPSLKLQEMAFLLDGFSLGHGYLALEAMAAQIPILFPKSRKSYGNVEDFLIKTSKQFKIKDIKEYKQKFLLNFKNNDELIYLSNKLLNDSEFNQFYGEHYKKVISKILPDSFEDFCYILK